MSINQSSSLFYSRIFHQYIPASQRMNPFDFTDHVTFTVVSLSGQTLRFRFTVGAAENVLFSALMLWLCRAAGTGTDTSVIFKYLCYFSLISKLTETRKLTWRTGDSVRGLRSVCMCVRVWVNLQSALGAPRKSAITVEADMIDGRSSGERGREGKWRRRDRRQEGRQIVLLCCLSVSLTPLLHTAELHATGTSGVKNLRWIQSKRLSLTATQVFDVVQDSECCLLLLDFSHLIGSVR